MTYQEFLQGPGFGARSESDPYGLGDYANGSVIGNSGLYKYGDESQDSFLQRLYGAASNPSSGFGTEARSFQDMQNAGLYNTLAPVNINGEMRSRIGENLNETLGQQTGDIQAYFNARGGPGAAYDQQYGWTMPTQDYETLNKFRAYNTRKMSGLNDWAPTLFGMAATAGVGALGAGAAVGAAEGGAAGGGAGGAGGGAFGLSEGTIGSLARGAVSTAGSTMNGGNGTSGLIGMGATLAGGYSADGLGDTSWGVNARDGSNMDFTDIDNYDPSFGGVNYNPDMNYQGMSGLEQYYNSMGLPQDQYSIQDAQNGSRAPGTETVGMDPANNPTWLSSVLKMLAPGSSNGSGGTDWAKLLGIGGSTALGYYGAQQQTQAYKDMQERYLGLGQSYRDRLNASYQPGFSMEQDPAYRGALDQASNSVLRKLSASGMNPFDNPGGLMEADKYVTQNVALPQLNTYRSQLASSGGLGVNQAGTAGMGAAGNAQGPSAALGWGLGGLTGAPQMNYGGMQNPYGNMRLNLGGGY